jgi:hypothetical protein
VSREDLRGALKATASALTAAHVPFALGGSYALWVHGAAEPDNDVDLVVAEPDADAAARALEAGGFELRPTPENWLFKVVVDEAIVDVLHRLNGIPVDAARVGAAGVVEVFGVRMRVLDPTQVVSVKLQVMNEHYCDFGALLTPVRAVREQIDWVQVTRDVTGNPFAQAFLFLLDRLGIVESPA